MSACTQAVVEQAAPGGFENAGWQICNGAEIRPEILGVPGAGVVRFRWKAIGIASTPGETPQKAPQETPRGTPDAILELLRHQPELTFSQMAPLLGKSESAVRRAVRKLRESGRLQRIGSAKGGHWQVIE